MLLLHFFHIFYISFVVSRSADFTTKISGICVYGRWCLCVCFFVVLTLLVGALLRLCVLPSLQCPLCVFFYVLCDFTIHI